MSSNERLGEKPSPVEPPLETEVTYWIVSSAEHRVRWRPGHQPEVLRGGGWRPFAELVAFAFDADQVDREAFVGLAAARGEALPPEEHESGAWVGQSESE